MDLHADPVHLRLVPEPGESFPRVVDVLLEGFRTVAFELPAPEADGAVVLAWPPALASRLSGRAVVVVRDSVTHAELATIDVAFDDSDARFELRDDQGRWLSVNKWGRLGVSFDGTDVTSVQERLLDRLEVLLQDLTEIGRAPFLVYGTLLGLVRDGRLIPHDDDADVGYLSAHDNPADVVRESYGIERALRERGYSVTRHSGGHLQLHFRTEAGDDHYLDVFTAFRTGGRTYLCFQVGADDLDLSERTRRPLGSRLLPVPADAERLLAATYGDGWRTPDPSFRFTTPWPVRSRLMAWMGEFNVQRDYWQDFYATAAADKVPEVESAFVRWVEERLTDAPPVLDVGAGTARDSRYLARKGHRVAAVDYSAAALERAAGAAAKEGWTACFHQLNLNDLHAVGRFVAEIDWSAGWQLYARFLVHAIDDQARANLWTLAKVVTDHGGEVWLEYRTDRDAQAAHVFGEHFRRYLSTAQVQQELEALGLSVLESLEARGMAVHGDEDPWVARMRVGKQS